MNREILIKPLKRPRPRPRRRRNARQSHKFCMERFARVHMARKLLGRDRNVKVNQKLDLNSRSARRNARLARNRVSEAFSRGNLNPEKAVRGTGTPERFKLRRRRAQGRLNKTKEAKRIIPVCRANLNNAACGRTHIFNAWNTL